MRSNGAIRPVVLPSRATRAPRPPPRPMPPPMHRGRQAAFGVAALHLVQQRHKDAQPDAPIGCPSAIAPPFT